MITELRGPLDPRTAARVRDLAAAAEAADGIEAFGEQTLLSLAAEDVPVAHLLATQDAEAAEDADDAADGPLVEYAQLDLAATEEVGAEIAVDPADRRRGHGAALLAAARELAAVEGRPLRVWAHGDLPAARALAARAGLAPVRELWQMARDLPADDVPGPDALPGLTVRPFVVGQDEQAWLDLNARAFAWHPEQGRMTLRDLRARQAEPWFDAGDLLLAERDGRLVASTWMKVEPGGDAGELYALAVDPDAQGQGLGRLLTRRTLDHLAARGLRRVDLYTEATNAGAVRTYTAAGFTPVRVDVRYG